MKKEEKNKEKNNASSDKKFKLLLILLAIIAAVITAVEVYNRGYIDSIIYPSEKENELSPDLVSLKCLLTDKEGKETIQTYNIFGVGDYLLCSINTPFEEQKQIRKITLGYRNNDVELTNIYSTTDAWNIKTDEFGFISISLKEDNSESTISDMRYLLHIKEKTDNKLELKLTNITVYYQDETESASLEEKIIKFDTQESRYYKNDGIITMEKKQDNGSFKKAQEYKCKAPDNCSENIATEAFVYQNDNVNTIMIVDFENDKFFRVILNVDKGIVGTYGDATRWLYSNKYEYGKGTYIYINKKDTDIYGVIDKEGNIIHEFNLSDTGALNKSGILDTVYSIEENMIVNKKDNKIGVSKLTSNDTVIDYNYESIRFIVETTSDGKIYTKTMNNKYFKAKLNGKWYLYSFDTKDKSTKEGYENLFVANDNIIVSGDGKDFYIRDYEGNKLVEDKIESLATEYPEYTCCGSNPGLTIEDNKTTLTIKTYKDWANFNEYEYNIANKTLTKKK